MDKWERKYDYQMALFTASVERASLTIKQQQAVLLEHKHISKKYIKSFVFNDLNVSTMSDHSNHNTIWNTVL